VALGDNALGASRAGCGEESRSIAFHMLHVNDARRASREQNLT
jgi:hypothetical protein